VVVAVGLPGGIGVREVLQRGRRGVGLTRAHLIQSRIHSGAVEVASRLFHAFKMMVVPQEPQKNRLQDILGVGRIAGNAVGGPENFFVVELEKALQFRERLLCCHLAIVRHWRAQAQWRGVGVVAGDLFHCDCHVRLHQRIRRGTVFLNWIKLIGT